MEFRMTTDLATAMPKEIAFNFDELKTELTQQLDHYNRLVVTEDAIQEARDDRANLRKLKDAIETRRKEVKKECEKPYKAFEKQVKELTALIDAPVAAIDGQIKAFEDSQREAKRKEVEAAYAEIVPENIRDIIPLSRILDQKWLNKTTTMKSVREALEDKAKRVNVDMALIDGADPKYAAAVRSKYIETLDVTAALNYQDKLAEDEARFQALQEAKAARAAQMAERQAQAPRVEEKQPEPAQEPVREPAPQAGPAEKMYSLRLEFHLTMNQANALKVFLSDNNIGYTKI